MDKEANEHLKKWRLILGKDSDPELSYPLEKVDEQKMDGALEALYETDRKGSLGPSAPNINRWLGDIRTYFPSSVVQLMQKDALERLEINQLLLEPELLASLEVDIHLAATLVSLNQVMPEKTKATARQVIQQLVQRLQQKLSLPLRNAISGSLKRGHRNFHPRQNEIDWNQTIYANLKHYQPNLKTIIPEKWIGYHKKQHQLKKTILLVDQSASMASSVVYACVLGAIMASVPTIKTHLIVFDTTVVDLTDQMEDPIDLLFASQLGGGTDIGNALQYASTIMERPHETIVILISDLYEGGREKVLLETTRDLVRSGVQLISLLALSDEGMPAYDHEIAQKIAKFGVPAFACTPDQFPDLMAAAIQKSDLRNWASKKGISIKN